jgi:hypothetical protein
MLTCGAVPPLPGALTLPTKGKVKNYTVLNKKQDNL